MMHTVQVFKNTVLAYEPPFRAICYACDWTATGQTEHELTRTGEEHQMAANDYSEVGDLHAEAETFIAEAFSEVPEELLRHHQNEFLRSTLAAWCENQVFLRRASSWQHALATFIHEANAGLDFNCSISEFLDDPELLKRWIRGDHL